MYKYAGLKKITEFLRTGCNLNFNELLSNKPNNSLDKLWCARVCVCIKFKWNAGIKTYSLT